MGWTLESCDFINKMIYRKTNKRLGFNGIFEVKEHEWFKGFNWEELEKKDDIIIFKLSRFKYFGISNFFHIKED